MSDDPVIEPAEFRRVLGHVPTGVTVVTCVSEDKPVGVAIGSFVSISLDPPLVGFFLGTESSSAPAIEGAASFCVNVLCDDQADLSGRMASKSEDKFVGVDWTPSPITGSPCFAGVHAVIDCRLDAVVPAGDHNLIMGRVLHLETTGEQPPMVFYQGRYATIGDLAEDG